MIKKALKKIATSPALTEEKAKQETDACYYCIIAHPYSAYCEGPTPVVGANRSPTVVHKSLHSAQLEADRLARGTPSTHFVIYKAIETVTAPVPRAESKPFVMPTQKLDAEF